MEQEKIYYGTIYTDSISLRNHLLEFLNSEDDSNKDEFIVSINYKSLGDLIDLIEHLKYSIKTIKMFKIVCVIYGNTQLMMKA